MKLITIDYQPHQPHKPHKQKNHVSTSSGRSAHID